MSEEGDPRFGFARDRRAALKALLATAGAPLVACSHAALGNDSSAAGALPIAVATGVYVLRGGAGDPDPVNRGRVGNAGFVVGEEGVVAIDSGTSYRAGRALLDAIARVTDKPVRLLLVTHTRQEFLFGAAAFQERGIPVRMHAAAARLMKARCETCLKNLRQQVGEAEMAGTRVFDPDELFDDAHTIGQAGRPLRVLHFGHSAGPGDVAVLDERSGVLFAGGLVDVGRIPDIQDSRVPEWQAALQTLRRERVGFVVPGHGPVSSPSAIDDVARYLSQLDARVRQLLREDRPLSEVADSAQLPAFADWEGYDSIHRRNASVLFVRLEYETLFQAPGDKS